MLFKKKYIYSDFSDADDANSFYRIFYDVWKYDDNHADHALAVCMYVYYAAWRRSKRDAGRRFFHIYVGRWQIQWKKADTFVKLFWRRMIWEGNFYYHNRMK